MLTNVESFKNLNPDAGEVVLTCRGYTGKMFGLGSNKQINGIFILTEDALHFFKNGLIEKVHNEWSLDGIIDISFNKGAISTRIELSEGGHISTMHLSSPWRVCEDFIHAVWRKILSHQATSSSRNVAKPNSEQVSKSPEAPTKSAASGRVKQLLRIHTEIPAKEISEITQDQAWEALREHAREWYRADEFVYLYDFSSEDKTYLKDRLAAVGIRTATKLSRKVSLFVTSDMADDYSEMSPRKAEKFDELMMLVAEFDIPMVYEFELDEIIRKMQRPRLLSDHFNEIDVV